MYVYVCIYMYIYINRYIYMYIYVYIHIYVCKIIYMYCPNTTCLPCRSSPKWLYGKWTTWARPRTVMAHSCAQVHQFS